MNTKLLLIAGAVSALLSSSAQAANILVNGSFDNTPCGAGYCNYAGGGNAGVFLDNVSVTGGVPEPAAWAMMLIGFSGLGALLRRRRASVNLATA